MQNNIHHLKNYVLNIVYNVFKNHKKIISTINYDI
jgi:hypothetical protein